MKPAGVEELVAQQLPDVSGPQAIEAQSEAVFESGLRILRQPVILHNVNTDVNRQQTERGGRFQKCPSLARVTSILKHRDSLAEKRPFFNVFWRLRRFCRPLPAADAATRASVRDRCGWGRNAAPIPATNR